MEGSSVSVRAASSGRIWKLTVDVINAVALAAEAIALLSAENVGRLVMPSENAADEAVEVPSILLPKRTQHCTDRNSSHP